MNKTARYLIANGVALVVLAVAFDKEDPLWVDIVAAVGGLLVINLLVAFIGPKGDPRRV